MPKMSKTQIRKRLSEASGKIGNVALECYNYPASTPLTQPDLKELTLCLKALNKVVRRMS